jgi:hypothetical protein
MFKPRYKKLYDLRPQPRNLVQHHCDSYITPFAVDLAEIGVDSGRALPTNDIVKFQKELDEKGSICPHGRPGGAIVVNEHATERRFAPRSQGDRLPTPGGHFLPCIGSFNCLYEKNEVIAST